MGQPTPSDGTLLAYFETTAYTKYSLGIKLFLFFKFSKFLMTCTINIIISLNRIAFNQLMSKDIIKIQPLIIKAVKEINERHV